VLLKALIKNISYINVQKSKDLIPQKKRDRAIGRPAVKQALFFNETGKFKS
jgi:hypothetical protein